MIRKEMEVLIKARSVQDEILKRREDEVENYRCKNQDLHSLLETTEITGEKVAYYFLQITFFQCFCFSFLFSVVDNLVCMRFGFQ